MDDLEFAIVTDGGVQVRTASRRGYLDYQVREPQTPNHKP